MKAPFVVRSPSSMAKLQLHTFAARLPEVGTGPRHAFALVELAGRARSRRGFAERSGALVHGPRDRRVELDARGSLRARGASGAGRARRARTRRPLRRDRVRPRGARGVRAERRGFREQSRRPPRARSARHRDGDQHLVGLARVRRRAVAMDDPRRGAQDRAAHRRAPVARRDRARRPAQARRRGPSPRRRDQRRRRRRRNRRAPVRADRLVGRRAVSLSARRRAGRPRHCIRSRRRPKARRHRRLALPHVHLAGDARRGDAQAPLPPRRTHDGDLDRTCVRGLSATGARAVRAR
jgi:hypothetical protein